MRIEEHVEEKELEEEADEKAWDDVKEMELDTKEVRTTRKEEVGYMENRKIWTVRPESECWEMLGKPPITVHHEERWS